MVTLTEVKSKAKKKGVKADFIYNRKRQRYEVVMPCGHLYKSLYCFKVAEL